MIFHVQYKAYFFNCRSLDVSIRDIIFKMHENIFYFCVSCISCRSIPVVAYARWWAKKDDVELVTLSEWIKSIGFVLKRWIRRIAHSFNTRHGSISVTLMLTESFYADKASKGVIWFWGAWQIWSGQINYFQQGLRLNKARICIYTHNKTLKNAIKRKQREGRGRYVGSEGRQDRILHVIFIYILSYVHLYIVCM